MNNHNTVIIRKPWGYEYLAYKGDVMSLWLLNINKDARTSLHCHPTKTTGLVLVDGCAEINFISDSKVLKAPAKQMIRRGLFHQTHALTNVIMLEAESPIDKDDLVRLQDNYGRENTGYENSEFEIPKNEDCIWITDPIGNEVNAFKIGNTNLYVMNACENALNKFNDNDLIMVLKGGLQKTINGKIHKVVVPGDVGQVKVVKRVAEEMDGFIEDSVIMFIN